MTLWINTSLTPAVCGFIQCFIITLLLFISTDSLCCHYCTAYAGGLHSHVRLSIYHNLQTELNTQSYNTL